MPSTMLAKGVFKLFLNYLNGLIFSIQFLCLFVFFAYSLNEICFLLCGKRIISAGKQRIFAFLLKHRLILISDPLTELKGTLEKRISTSLKEEINKRILDRTSFETAEWVNVLLYEILCTSKSRRLIDRDQEALLSALTKISREAIESKLSDYQKESWLFLSSLDLEYFSFGDRLPVIERVRIASKPSLNSLALVLDISYTGGIKVGLKAAMAMNFRDFAAVINFNSPSKFKLVLKLDGDPAPRLSLMLTDLPAYEMTVSMKSKHLERASNLMKTLIEKFVRTRLCYPNYTTVIFRPQDPGKFLQIANAKQYQSQLRVRLVSVNLNPEHPELFSPFYPELNVIAALNLGEFTCKTEVINAAQSKTRWNSIHTFNIFNGLEDSPKFLKISLYQVLDSNSTLSRSFSSSQESIAGLGRSLNHLGRIEIPYLSITPGILDIRTLPLTTDPNSSLSIEMYLHHMEEDGEADSIWIFWNQAKPKKTTTLQASEASDKSLEELNWQSIKFIISKLSYDDDLGYNSDPLLDSEMIGKPEEEFNDASSMISFNAPRIEPENLLEILQGKLEKIIFDLEAFEEDEIIDDPVYLLKAFKYELTDFIDRFHLNRSALSVEALPAHNKRLLALLQPLMRQFIFLALKSLEYSGRSTEIYSSLDELYSYVCGSSYALTLSPIESVVKSNESTIPSCFETVGHIGDIPVRIKISEDSGVSFEATGNRTVPLDAEGVLYSPKSLSTLNLASTDFMDSVSVSWEIVLLKDRFISFVPLGQSHLFPHRLIDLHSVRELDLIKDRNAFTIGFDANLSSREAFTHANNGLLRLKLDSGEVVDLLGEPRSCDQWYCIISARMFDDFGEKNIELKWSEIAKIWLLPHNLPALKKPHAIALKLETNLVLLLAECDQLYKLYCILRDNFKSVALNRTISTSTVSSILSTPNSSVNGSPKSRKSSIFTFSRKSLSSSTSTQNYSKDPFTSKSRYDRLVMTRNLEIMIHGSNDRLSSSLNASSSTIKMDSLDNLLNNSSSLLTSRNKINISASILTENAFAFKCTCNNFSSGYLCIGPEFVFYYTDQTLDTPLTYPPLRSSNILLICRSQIQNVSKASPNWISSFSGLILKVKRELSSEPIIFTGFESNQEMSLAFDALLEIY